MAQTASRKLLVNIAVRDLKKSMSFYDLDGHHWEVLWTDPKFAEA